MTAMTMQEQETYFLRKAALHECGHALVIRHFGLEGLPMIWRNTSDNLDEEKLWLGRTICNFRRPSALRLRRIAIAGLLAEYIDKIGSTTGCDGLYLDGLLTESFDENYDELGVWSKTDWDGAQGWTSQDVFAVVRILKRNWKLLLGEANRLMSDAVEAYC